jgi:hydroxymethylpyrimidine/phosphomethylpyrimidine kinase
LLADEAVDALRERILPLATVVTPNLPEASRLAGFAIEGRDLMEDGAEAIVAMGPRSVLVKGGHLEGTDRADDLFFDGHDLVWIEGPRVPTRHTHGTGCVLSSAIAAHLARGEGLREAVRLAKAFVTEAIRHALPLGHGIGPVDPMFGRPSPG